MRQAYKTVLCYPDLIHVSLVEDGSSSDVSDTVGWATCCLGLCIGVSCVARHSIQSYGRHARQSGTAKIASTVWEVVDTGEVRRYAWSGVMDRLCHFVQDSNVNDGT